MTSINLLPWREALKKQRKQQFLTSLGAAGGIAGAIVLGVHVQIATQMSYQESRNTYMQQQIERVERQIKEIDAIEKEKQRLLARMNVIQQLQLGRPQIVHVFDELVRTLPDGVFLTSIKQNGSGLALQGQAQSNARISAYMRNLDASEWFSNPQLSVIEASKTGEAQTVADRTSRFTLNISLVNPTKPEGEQG